MRRGFTLVELLVVVGIILLITALSKPAFSVIFRSQGIAKEARKVQTAILQTRSRAVGVGRQQMLVFRNDHDGKTGNNVLLVKDAGEDLDGDGNPWLLAGGMTWETDMTDVQTIQLSSGFQWGMGTVANVPLTKYPVVICMPDGTLKIYYDVGANQPGPFLATACPAAATDLFNSGWSTNCELKIQKTGGNGDEYYLHFMKSSGRVKIHGP